MMLVQNLLKCYDFVPNRIKFVMLILLERVMYFNAS